MLKRGIILLALAATSPCRSSCGPRQASPGEADDTVVVITPHNEAIRHEFALGFSDWYKARTGRTVFVDWRVIGGTSEIARYLEGEYVASFRNLWTARLRPPLERGGPIGLPEREAAAGRPRSQGRRGRRSSRRTSAAASTCSSGAALRLRPAGGAGNLVD
jgi:hypothetical protein